MPLTVGEVETDLRKVVLVQDPQQAFRTALIIYTLDSGPTDLSEAGVGGGSAFLRP